MIMPVRSQNRVIFLLKDPHWSFVWWSLTFDAISAARSAFHGCESDIVFTIRILDITNACFNSKPSQDSFDIQVKGCTDHWYVHISVSNRTYIAQIGFKSESGFYMPIAISNPLNIPRDCISECTVECWDSIKL